MEPIFISVQGPESRDSDEGGAQKDDDVKTEKADTKNEEQVKDEMQEVRDDETNEKVMDNMKEVKDAAEKVKDDMKDVSDAAENVKDDAEKITDTEKKVKDVEKVKDYVRSDGEKNSVDNKDNAMGLGSRQQFSEAMSNTRLDQLCNQVHLRADNGLFLKGFGLFLKLLFFVLQCIVSSHNRLT